MKTASLFLLAAIICLFTAPLFAQDTNPFDSTRFFTEKKALIKETVPLSEQEGKVFWPLYDEYMQTYAEIFKRRAELEKGMLEDQDGISEKEARQIVDDYYAIVDDSLKAKLAMVKKMRQKLPELRVLQFFQLEEKIEAGFLYHSAEVQPLVK